MVNKSRKKQPAAGLKERGKHVDGGRKRREAWFLGVGVWADRMDILERMNIKERQMEGRKERRSMLVGK